MVLHVRCQCRCCVVASVAHRTLIWLLSVMSFLVDFEVITKQRYKTLRLNNIQKGGGSEDDDDYDKKENEEAVKDREEGEEKQEAEKEGEERK